MASLGFYLDSRSQAADGLSATFIVFLTCLTSRQTDLPEIETALPEIETALPEIEILSHELDKEYQPHEGLIYEL